MHRLGQNDKNLLFHCFFWQSTALCHLSLAKNGHGLYFSPISDTRNLEDFWDYSRPNWKRLEKVCARQGWWALHCHSSWLCIKAQWNKAEINFRALWKPKYRHLEFKKIVKNVEDYSKNEIRSDNKPAAVLPIRYEDQDLYKDTILSHCMKNRKTLKRYGREEL